MSGRKTPTPSASAMRGIILALALGDRLQRNGGAVVLRIDQSADLREAERWSREARKSFPSIFSAPNQGAARVRSGR